MPQHAQYRKGNWLANCDICGLTFYNDELAQDWDGSWRCIGAAGTGCWEGRHPQDFVRGVKDDQSTPWARPWVPRLYQPALTITTAGASSVQIALADITKFPSGITPTGNYCMAALTGSVGGVAIDDVEVVKIIQFTINVGVSWTVFFQPTSQVRAWDVGSSIVALTGAITP